MKFFLIVFLDLFLWACVVTMFFPVTVLVSVFPTPDSVIWMKYWAIVRTPFTGDFYRELSKC